MFELLSKPENRNPANAEQIIHLVYGTQAYNGDYHLAGFTAELLVEYLKRAGLVVRRAEIRDEWLFDLNVVKIGNIVSFEDIVHNAYFEVLRRPADNDGLRVWAEQLNNGASASQIKDALLKSTEFEAIKTRSAYVRGY